MKPFRFVRRGVGPALAAMAVATIAQLLPPAISQSAASPAACVRTAMPTIANLPTATRARISVVQAPEVRSRYNLPAWMDEKWTLIIHEGDMLVDRHLLMDAQRTGHMDETRAIHWPALFGPIPCDAPIGIVVDGNLKVNGSILNANSAGGTALIVTGQTKARSLLAGGSYVAFGGPADFSEAIYGHGTQGQLLFSGPVSAPLLINADHMLELRDKTRSSGIAAYYNTQDSMPGDGTKENSARKRTGLPPSVSTVVRPQLKSFTAIQKAMLNGRPVLKMTQESQ